MGVEQGKEDGKDALRHITHTSYTSSLVNAYTELCPLRPHNS